MPKQKIKLTKKEILEEKKDNDIWWKDSNRNGRKAILGTLIFIVFIFAVVSTAFLFSQQKRFDQNENQILKQELELAKKNMQADNELLQSKLDAAQKKLDQAAAAETAKNQTVTVEGSLSYPGSYIPQDMQICAQDLNNTDNLVCTKEQVMDKKYTYGVGYKLELTPGSYNVYATVPAWTGYKSYYDDFVTCGLKYGCASHNPIEVKVESGKNLTGIDPIDWYKQS